MLIEKITFAGHSATFLSCNDGTVVAIDPWLAGNPSCPDVLKHPARIDLIVLSHGHSDHASEAASLAKNFGSDVVATFELATLIGQEGLPEGKAIGMNKGGTFGWKELSITLTNAFHSSSYETANGTVYAGEPCGIVIRDGITSVYHAGDTCLFSDMSLIGETYHPNVALLPIGDLYTMGPQEAAKAASLVGCKRAIPIHYGTFGALTGTAEEFSLSCKKFDIEPVVLAPGESLQLS
ncbi:MAG: metal-dependent hydrolase [Bdellovibrionales bacterium]|nr:metal-dependent hydrolase [Bdellovibrionales bacterium]